MKIPIGQILMHMGYITPFELVKALDTAQALPEKSRLRLGDVLLNLGYITDKQLQDALEEQTNFGSVPIGHILVQEQVISAAQLEHLLKLQKQASPQHKKRLGEMVVAHRLASPHQIERALSEYYKKRKKKQIKVMNGLNVKRVQT